MGRWWLQQQVTLDPWLFSWPTSCLLYRTRLFIVSFFFPPFLSFPCVSGNRPGRSSEAGPFDCLTELVAYILGGQGEQGMNVRPRLGSCLMWTHCRRVERDREPNSGFSDIWNMAGHRRPTSPGSKALTDRKKEEEEEGRKKRKIESYFRYNSESHSTCRRADSIRVPYLLGQQRAVSSILFDILAFFTLFFKKNLDFLSLSLLGPASSLLGIPFFF